MKFTFDWLKDHLRTDLTYDEIADKLVDLGIEVEEIIDGKKKFENFVVGYIESAEKHPNADKLKVCKVDVGTEKLQIVCGAKNARPGIYVAVALVGALIPASGENLKKGQIRGIESCGMMCSDEELLLDDDGIDGIIELPTSLNKGQDLATALKMDDVVFDVSLTPNRADCFSVRGIARDLAAAGAGELLDVATCEIFEEIENPIDVEIKSQNCEYFSTLAIKDISGQTPDYIARRLRSIGQNLINFPVDVANYVCIDIGQPLHIFDLDKLPKKLIVRDSKKGEALETLNNKKTILPDGAIVVSSENEVFSIAGIMGGEKTGVSEGSKNILIESAYFNQIAIAQAGQKLRLTSDSRTRFERGIDPENVDFAMRYVASIISKDCNCKISNVRKCGKLPENKKTVELTFSKFAALTALSKDVFIESKDKLEKLGMKVRSETHEKMIIETPSWRHDLEIEEDIIEEILRLIGFEHIEEFELPLSEPITHCYSSDKISDALVFNGYFEVKTFSFMDRKSAEMFAPADSLIDLQDASSEFSTLRPTVVATLLKSVKNSQNKSQKNSKLFEVGRFFNHENGKLTERTAVVALMSEKTTARTWRKKQEDVSIFDVKMDLEKILNMMGINYRLQAGAPSYYHPGRCGTYIFQKDTVVAHFGEIHPSILSRIGINGPVVCFELFLDHAPELFEYKTKKPLFLSPYQATTRDFSFIVNKSIKMVDILNAIKKQRIEEIQDISVFDVYESQALGDDNKAIAFEVCLQSRKGTLSDEQIGDVSKKIIDSITKNCAGILRDQ